jgi:hypothetical protein
VTAEGKARVGEASAREWRKWRQQVGLDPDWRYGSTWLSRRQRETAADWVAKHGPHED